MCLILKTRFDEFSAQNVSTSLFGLSFEWTKIYAGGWVYGHWNLIV